MNLVTEDYNNIDYITQENDNQTNNLGINLNNTDMKDLEINI